MRPGREPRESGEGAESIGQAGEREGSTCRRAFLQARPAAFVRMPPVLSPGPRVAPNTHEVRHSRMTPRAHASARRACPKGLPHEGTLKRVPCSTFWRPPFPLVSTSPGWRLAGLCWSNPHSLPTLRESGVSPAAVTQLLLPCQPYGQSVRTQPDVPAWGRQLPERRAERVTPWEGFVAALAGRGAWPGTQTCTLKRARGGFRVSLALSLSLRGWKGRVGLGTAFTSGVERRATVGGCPLGVPSDASADYTPRGPAGSRGGSLLSP